MSLHEIEEMGLPNRFREFGRSQSTLCFFATAFSVVASLHKGQNQKQNNRRNADTQIKGQSPLVPEAILVIRQAFGVALRFGVHRRRTAEKLSQNPAHKPPGIRKEGEGEEEEAIARSESLGSIARFQAMHERKCDGAVTISNAV